MHREAVALNRESYNAIAEPWDAARTHLRSRERAYLDALLVDLAPGSQILDLGCGTGRPIAEAALQRGHRLTGVDQAEALLALARARFPEATWIAAAIEQFESTQRFAAIVCWDSLFHIERSEHESLFARFVQLLEPGGRLMLSLGGSDHPAFTDEMFGRQFFYDSHPPERALELLALCGFTPIVSELLDPPAPPRDRGRYAVVARLP
jgi:cyclopropane fatty-acyl-phospholipid synthase-like methyltransferase